MPKKKALAALKAALQDSPEAANEFFKKKFTPGFYHGSPSPNITSFDPMKSTVRDTDFVTPGVTFVTKSPNFADSFTNGKGPYISLKTGDAVPAQAYTKGATMYPVSVDLTNHFDPTTPEGFEIVRQYVAKKYAEDPKMAEKFKSRILDPHSNWTTMESPSFLQHLRDTGHTSFAVNESGYQNVGVLDPSKIRGKFAEYNPEYAESADFMKAEGGLIHLAGGGVPEKVVKAYKLFRTKPNDPGTLYPLFVHANKPVPIGEWVQAEVGPVAASGKVKSKLGELAYRPGWHAGDLPIATHIGGKSDPKLKAPDFRRPDEVWAEVEMPNDIDWQTIANQRAELNKAGQPIARTAHITDEVPFGGHYRYKTSPNMQGNWLIGGDMKVNRILTDEEVQAINEAAGAADLPRFTPLPGKADGGPITQDLDPKHLQANLTGAPLYNTGDRGPTYQLMEKPVNTSVDVRPIPSMSGLPGVGYMQAPVGALARLQMEQELADKARLRAALSGTAMAIPGQHGVKTMPGQMEVGYKGPGGLDISAFRTINPVPGKGHIQGLNARYKMEFKKGGKVKK